MFLEGEVWVYRKSSSALTLRVDGDGRFAPSTIVIKFPKFPTYQLQNLIPPSDKHLTVSGKQKLVEFTNSVPGNIPKAVAH